MLFIIAGCGHLAAQKLTIRDPYEGAARGREAFQNFIMVREDHEYGEEEPRPPNQFGILEFSLPYSLNKSITWRLSPEIELFDDFVIWPARIEDPTNPCRDFRLSRLKSDVGILARDGVVRNLIAGNIDQAAKKVVQLAYIYGESERLAEGLGFDWRMAFHVHLTTMIDIAYKGNNQAAGPLSPASALSREKRIEGGKIVSGWIRLHRGWMMSPRLTNAEKARMTIDMMIRSEACSSATYLKRFLPLGGSWPDRTLGDFKEELGQEAVKELFEDDIEFLYDCLTTEPTRNILDEVVQGGTNLALKPEWDTLLSNQSVDGITLFKDGDEQVLANVRMAALEKLVDIVNKSFSGGR